MGSTFDRARRKTGNLQPVGDGGLPRCALINTQLQLGVSRAGRQGNRFSGFFEPPVHPGWPGLRLEWPEETVETVGPQRQPPSTQLKLGVNERAAQPDKI
jgi:hypothetical protein